MSEPTDAPEDFEAFWRKFLADHPSSANRWAHVTALVAATAGLAIAARSRRIVPLALGASAAALLAVGGHPVFQGDRPKNFGHPLWAARAFVRLCARTVTGRATRELEALRADT
ncbi:MAG: Mpo1-like protein [Polyangiaceae bacterium]